MELFIALASVIVAAATLFLANTARHRFDTYEGRLSKTEQNATSLTHGQLELSKDRETDKQAVSRLNGEVTAAFKDLGSRLD